MKNKIREIGEGKAKHGAIAPGIIGGKDDAARTVLKREFFLKI